MKFLKLNDSAVSKLLEARYIALHWTGFTGKIYNDILSHHGIQPTCYIGEQSSHTQYNGLPVYSFDHLPFEARDCILILTMDPYALRERFQFIQENYSFQDVWIAQESDVILFCLNHIKETLKKNEISFDHEAITLPWGIVHNPFRESYAYQREFALQAKDLILPYLGDNYLLKEGPYEFGPVQLKKNDIVLDCGANIGLFSNYAASKGGYVYAFEPVLETGEYFLQNQKLYSGQVMLISKAVEVRSGEKRMYQYGDNWGANSTEIRIDAPERTVITVPTISIDEFVRSAGLSQVNFIKADVEGAERKLLEGAEWTLRTFAPSLALCSYHFPDDRAILPRLIQKANPRYRIWHQWEKIYAHVDWG